MSRRLEGDILRAKALRRDRQEVSEARAFMEAYFLSAKTIFCSPLTRAVQSAIVALRPLTSRMIGRSHRAPCKIQLLKDLRERRNRGGWDTTGTQTGGEVALKARRCLEDTLGPERAQEYDSILHEGIDYSDVVEEWWDDHAESKEHVRSRIQIFMERLRQVPEEESPVIAVGHSHFFREIFRLYGPNSGEFRNKVLSNCGVVAVNFAFTDDSEPMITGQRLIFTSYLEKGQTVTGMLMEGFVGPRVAALACLGPGVATCAALGGWLGCSEIVGALSLGLLLAQAWQRFLFGEKYMWAAIPLWICCAFGVWLWQTNFGGEACSGRGNFTSFPDDVWGGLFLRNVTLLND